MFDIQSIETSFLSLVGWEQNADPSGWQLTGLTTSDSGLFMNSIHSMLTIDNLVALAPRFDEIHAGDDPARNTAFTGWVERLMKTAIQEGVGIWIDTKIGRKTATNLLADSRLFNIAGSFDQLQTKNGRFVGISITPKCDKGIAGLIRKVGIQMEQAESFALRLFKGDSAVEVQNQAITYAVGGSVQWVDVNWALESGTTYFIGYHEDEITGQAINGVLGFGYEDHGRLYFPSERHFNATAFSIAKSNDSNMWPVSGNTYTSGTNYGLNLDLSFHADYTNLVIEQRLIFARFIALQLAINILKELISNPNSKLNRNTENAASIKAWLLDEINGNKNDKNDTSLAGKYRKALAAIQFEYNQVNDTLLPEVESRPVFESLGSEPTGYYEF